MLRFTIAALAVAAALYAWGDLSGRLLPWPKQSAGRSVPAPPPNQVTLLPIPAIPPSAQSPLVQLTPDVQIIEPPGESIEDPPAVPLRSSFGPPPDPSDELLADNSKLWPLYVFQRDAIGPPTHSAASAYFVLNICIGVVAVFVVALLQREQGSGRRRMALLGLVALLLILVTDVTQGIWMEWPSPYIFALCADHFVAVLLALGVAAGVLILFAWLAPTEPARSPTA